MDLVYILIGLAGLYFGGAGLVRGAVDLAQRMGVSQLLIGLTVVGMGTSAPELLVSMKAALNGQSAIALGNVVGSNIANVLLILGISALVFPILHWDKAVRRDVVVAIAAALLLMLLAQAQVIGRVAGLIMFLGLIAYLFMVYQAEKNAPSQAVADVNPAVKSTSASSLIASIAFVAGGLVLLVIGADYLVFGASNIARSLGISEAVIGLTIVAVGTSLPELATSVTAAVKRHSDVALGNVVGSNIFNILGILGLTSLVSPVGVDPQFRSFDIPLMLATTIALAAILFIRYPITRILGGVMVALYTLYTIWLFV